MGFTSAAFSGKGRIVLLLSILVCILITTLSLDQKHSPRSLQTSDNHAQGVLLPLAWPDSRTSTPEGQQELVSRLTPDGTYFFIDLAEGYQARNPNIIPHPSRSDAWIVVAQQHRGALGNHDQTPWSTERACTAVFQPGGNLTCDEPSEALPMAATAWSPHCTDDLAMLNLNVGPHDARVFYGPDVPYAMYGSQSSIGCLGQFVQDFRFLVDWGAFRTADDIFSQGTELHSPEHSIIQKNFFLLWDSHGERYLHTHLHPQRVYAKALPDGTAGDNIAPQAATTDEQCWQTHLQRNPLDNLPSAVDRASVHQATNSLAVTLCPRHECERNVDNTFIMHVFQHKVPYGLGGVYYLPFVVLFRETYPFNIYAISTKPLWIRGRGETTEMHYMTSMSWKSQDQRYHGYLDDPLFLAFGIQDRLAAAVDVTAESLLRELHTC